MTQPDETRNLFENAGPKETASDFTPAAGEMHASIGTLHFFGGAAPTKESAHKIYDELDLQRATQAYIDFYPALSLYAIVRSQVRDFGMSSSSDIVVMSTSLTPTENYLTGNNSTVYAVGSLDLKLDGPTVVEIPEGMMGNANDAAFRYLTDFGPTGPDNGKGGRYLFVPPGYEADLPDGYFVVSSPSYRIWVMMRGFDVGTGDAAVQWFRDRLEIYALESGPRDHQAIDGTGAGANTLAPEDGRAYDMLNEIIQYEPTALFDSELLGRIATLGIQKGKAFAPDERMTSIFDEAAKLGVAMCRAILYANRDPEILYWPNRHWEKMFIRNTEFVVDDIADTDAQTLWLYQAICVSPSLLSTTPGVGTAYLTGIRDKDGSYLDGGKDYRLRVPANPPAQRFWAVTAYDPTSRSLLGSGGPITVSSLGAPDVNDDGTVDVYFGSTAPAGKEKNWIRTDPSKGFFVVFRFYGPLQGYIDKTWVLNDIEPE